MKKEKGKKKKKEAKLKVSDEVEVGPRKLTRREFRGDVDGSSTIFNRSGLDRRPLIGRNDSIKRLLETRSRSPPSYSRVN